MFAYLNDQGDVLATSSAQYSLVAAQSAIPGITTVVAEAPEGLRRMDEATATEPFWHRRTSGDGTDISHYSEVQDLGPKRATLMLEIDARTRELIAQGFEYPTASGNMFSLSTESQLKMVGAYSFRDDASMVYPQRWNTRENTAAVTLADAAALRDFYLVGIGTVRAHLDSGTTLKDAARAAQTLAELDAVVDER